MPDLSRPLPWLVVTVLLLAACTLLPIRIKDDYLRNFVMKWVLVPVSLILIVYAYPVGIEIFKQIAINW